MKMKTNWFIFVAIIGLLSCPVMAQTEAGKSAELKKVEEKNRKIAEEEAAALKEKEAAAKKKKEAAAPKKTETEIPTVPATSTSENVTAPAATATAPAAAATATAPAATATAPAAAATATAPAATATAPAATATAPAAQTTTKATAAKTTEQVPAEASSVAPTTQKASAVPGAPNIERAKATLSAEKKEAAEMMKARNLGTTNKELITSAQAEMESMAKQADAAKTIKFEKAKMEADSQRKKIKVTLVELQNMAVAGNPSLAVYAARIQTATANIKQALAAYYPTLSVEGRVSRLRDEAYVPYTSKSNYFTNLHGEWVLFDGFQRTFNYLTAKYNETNAIETERDARRQMLQAVADAFFNVLLYRDKMNVAKEDADFNNVLLDDARKRYDSGVAKTSEVLNFVLQVKMAEVNYISAEQNWQTSMVALGNLVAVDFQQLPCPIWDLYELEATQDINEKLPPLDSLLTSSRERRPDLKALEAKIVNARDAVQAAWNTLYPTFYLYGNYGFDRYSSANFNNSENRAIDFGLAMKWTIFEGLKTPAQIAAERANLSAAIKERESLLNDIDATLRKNLLAVDSSRKQFKYQDEILKTAKEIRELVRQEYLGGTTTITRLNEAQTNVTNAASDRSSAYMQVLNNLETTKSTAGLTLQ